MGLLSSKTYNIRRQPLGVGNSLLYGAWYKHIPEGARGSGFITSNKRSGCEFSLCRKAAGEFDGRCIVTVKINVKKFCISVDKGS